MSETTTVLDERQLEQALLVLERERPSPSDEFRFEALTTAAWTAIGLTAAWVAMFFLMRPLAWYLIRAAAAAYVVAVALFFGNFGLVRKMWRAALARRRLHLLPYLKAFVRARRRQHPLIHFLSYGLAVAGVLLCAIGALGVVADRLDPNPSSNPEEREAGWALEGGTTFFGLACMLMCFVVQGHDAVAAIDDLHASLMNGERAGEGGTTVPTAVYDEITVIEREQISQDRKRTIAAARGMQLSAYAVRVSRDIYARVPELKPDEWSAISRRIHQLQSDLPLDAEHPTEGISFLRVPPTSWEIGVRVDQGRREVQLIALRRWPSAPDAGEVAG